MTDDPEDFDGFDEYDDDDLSPEELEELSLDEHESALIHQDLVDLTNFETTFRAEGYRGVSVFCQDCQEEHYYPWDMLRENLTTLLETGETPVHEPAFQPDPDQYVPWEYARGYVDALQDAGVSQRVDVGACPRCRFRLPDMLSQGNFCPRCGTPLLGARLWKALKSIGLDDHQIDAVLKEIGMPG